MRPRVEVRATGGARALRVDGTLASWYAPGSAATGSVWDALALPLLALPPARRRAVLVLGLGGGSAARLIRALAPRARIVGVERDPEVLRAARHWFDLDEVGIEVIEGDAYQYLRRVRARFDAVVEDVFVGCGRAVGKPDWLPEPGLELAARRLASGGILVSNCLDEAPAVGRLLRQRFPRVLRVAVEDYDNQVWAGSAAPLDARQLRAAGARIPALAPALARLQLRSLQGARAGRR